MPARQNTHKNTSGHSGARQGYFNKKKFEADRYTDDADRMHPSVLSASTSMCCRRCADKIKWKIDYGKYQAHFGRARKCNVCNDHAVAIAYHRVCQECARKEVVCAKCQLHPKVSEERALKETYEARSSDGEADAEAAGQEGPSAKAATAPPPAPPSETPSGEAPAAPAKPVEEWGAVHDSDDDELQALAGLDVHRLRAHKRRLRDEADKERFSAMRERERRAAMRKKAVGEAKEVSAAASDDDDAVITDDDA